MIVSNANTSASTDTPLLVKVVQEPSSTLDKELNESEQFISSKREYWRYVYDEVV